MPWVQPKKKSLQNCRKEQNNVTCSCTCRISPFCLRSLFLLEEAARADGSRPPDSCFSRRSAYWIKSSFLNRSRRSPSVWPCFQLLPLSLLLSSCTWQYYTLYKSLCKLLLFYSEPLFMLFPLVGMSFYPLFARIIFFSCFKTIDI